jgi:hypothetical protein
MDQAEHAFWLGVWRGFLAGLIFLIITGCYLRSAESALLAGAYIALIYAIVMWIDAPRWRMASARFSFLRFAQSAAALAIALCLCSRLV